MTTLFLIQVTLPKACQTYGPYLSLKEASEIFSEHLTDILFANGFDYREYKAELIEAIPSTHTWDIIDIKITSTETIKLDAE